MAAVIVMSAASAYAQTESARVTGSVVAASGSESFPVPGVTLTLTCGSQTPATDVTDAQGQYHFDNVPAGECTVAAELQGFATAESQVAVNAGQTSNVDLRLTQATLHEEVTVRAAANLISSNPIDTHVSTTNAEMMAVAPLANERFQDALPLIPGVVRGPDGLLNISGLRSNQAGLMFNNADGSDPVTGEDAIELPIDAVSTVQVRGSAFAPEFGLSAGAMTTVETKKAGDAWHVTLNDLEPRVARRGGVFRGVESWTPRATFGGPVIPGKLSILESMQYEYSLTRVFSLPAFQSDTELQSFESYTRADWLPTDRQHVTMSAMFSPRKTLYAGLNTFNAQPVTPNVKNRNSLGSVSDSIITGQQSVLETRASFKQFDATIYPNSGDVPMTVTPDGNIGSYFNNQDRNSQRAEWVTTFTFMPIGPSHLLKVGSGVTYEAFDGTSVNDPVSIQRANGMLSQQTAFVGAGALGEHRWLAQGYAQDSWTIATWFTALYGARFDVDSFTRDTNVAPRGSFTAAITGDGRTVLRGGAGLFYNPIPLNVATFTQQQARLVTSFGADGVSVVASQLYPNVVAGSLHTPRSVDWNLELDREWLTNFFVRVGYQERQNRFEALPDWGALADGSRALVLRTDGQSHYREGQVTARYQFHGTDQVVASYTRSSARGDLNDYNSYFGNIQSPVIYPNSRGPLAWDAPNRFLIWSNVSLPNGFIVFPLFEIRTGFPITNVDQNQNVVGTRNEAGRFPTFMSADLQVSKRFRLFGHNATLGVKIFDITNHYNPRDYWGNIASANFGGFANGVGRSFRGRWIYEF